jgi:hypothetical protein
VLDGLSSLLLLLSLFTYARDCPIDLEESDPLHGSEALSGVATNRHEQCRFILDRFEKWAPAVFSL